MNLTKKILKLSESEKYMIEFHFEIKKKQLYSEKKL